MMETGLAVMVALFSWWFSTGAILFLNQLPRQTFAWSMGLASLIAGVAVWAILETRHEATSQGAYVGFLGGLALWGWHELSFLTGIITGPRRQPCPEGAVGRQRFAAATATLITHEVAIFLTLLALIGLLVGSDNQTALFTFAALWVLRLSAKFNIFLGIPNLTEEFLPSHLDYLKTYFRIRPMNGLFPISVSVGTIAAAAILMSASLPTATPFEVTAALLVGTLIALGVFEHWMMVLPLPDAALWRWAMISDSPEQEQRERRTTSVDGARSPTKKSKTFQSKPCEGSEQPALATAYMGARP
jgi:putative photosynthetic complex assembly protein 2